MRTFCALMLGTLLLITIGTAMAAEPDYERISYPTSEIPTIDGMWTTDNEWTDGEMTMIGEDIAFTSTWDVEEDVMTRWIVEFFSDTTDDPGDYWQFCIDPEQAGGAAPQLGTHRMIQIIGHTDLVWYLGDGETWTETTGSTVLLDWANTLSASPTNSTPHWILEFQIAKNSGGYNIENVWNFLLGASDASNPGFKSWPPTDPNVPDEWGVENYSLEPIPEALTFGVMALLSTVSMLVGYKYFVKRKETKTQ
jgi:hypothetical protein